MIRTKPRQDSIRLYLSPAERASPNGYGSKDIRQRIAEEPTGDCPGAATSRVSPGRACNRLGGGP
jgi:hypothetical protein